MDSWTSTWAAAAERARQMAASLSETTAKLQPPLDWSTAAENAREMASRLETVSKSAQEVAAQLQENTKVLAEEAKQKLRELKINESFVSLEQSLNTLNNKFTQDAQEEAASEEELLEYGLTPEFQEFVRSLNYSTFRDFPPEHVQPLEGLQEGEESAGGGGESRAETSAAASGTQRPLTPWQARHAALVVQSIKEVNELRFVLCPRRMNDNQFWAIYFTLARKYLPLKAFDQGTPVVSFQPPKAAPAEQARALGALVQDTLRTSFKAINIPSLKSAKGFMSDWSTITLTSPRVGDAQPDDKVDAAPTHQPPAPRSTIMDADPDLEEYLKVAAGEGSGSDAEDDGDQMHDLDLESYIKELKSESEDEEAAQAGQGVKEQGGADDVRAQGSSEEEGSGVDLEEGLAAMQNEDGDRGGKA